MGAREGGAVAQESLQLLGVERVDHGAARRLASKTRVALVRRACDGPRQPASFDRSGETRMPATDSNHANDEPSGGARGEDASRTEAPFELTGGSYTRR